MGLFILTQSAKTIDFGEAEDIEANLENAS